MSQMIGYAMRDHNEKVPHSGAKVGTVDDIARLREGERVLVPLFKYQISPRNPVRDEMREYINLNGELYFKVWEKGLG